jgi:hypothetical protein
MTNEKLLDLLREARAMWCEHDEYADPAILARIDAALAEHEEVRWRQVNPTTQEAFVEQKHAVRLSVERVVFNDGKVGWWARYKNSLINAYDTEDEAKTAVLKVATEMK